MPVPSPKKGGGKRGSLGSLCNVNISRYWWYSCQSFFFVKGRIIDIDMLTFYANSLKLCAFQVVQNSGKSDVNPFYEGFGIEDAPSL